MGHSSSKLSHHSKLDRSAGPVRQSYAFPPPSPNPSSPLKGPDPVFHPPPKDLFSPQSERSFSEFYGPPPPRTSALYPPVAERQGQQAEGGLRRPSEAAVYRQEVMGQMRERERNEDWVTPCAGRIAVGTWRQSVSRKGGGGAARRVGGRGGAGRPSYQSRKSSTRSVATSSRTRAYRNVERGARMAERSTTAESFHPLYPRQPYAIPLPPSPYIGAAPSTPRQQHSRPARLNLFPPSSPLLLSVNKSTINTPITFDRDELFLPPLSPSPSPSSSTTHFPLALQPSPELRYSPMIVHNPPSRVRSITASIHHHHRSSPPPPPERLGWFAASQQEQTSALNVPASPLLGSSRYPPLPFPTPSSSSFLQTPASPSMQHSAGSFMSSTQIGECDLLFRSIPPPSPSLSPSLAPCSPWMPPPSSPRMLMRASPSPSHFELFQDTSRDHRPSSAVFDDDHHSSDEEYGTFPITPRRTNTIHTSIAAQGSKTDTFPYPSSPRLEFSPCLNSPFSSLPPPSSPLVEYAAPHRPQTVSRHALYDLAIRERSASDGSVYSTASAAVEEGAEEDRDGGSLPLPKGFGMRGECWREESVAWRGK